MAEDHRAVRGYVLRGTSPVVSFAIAVVVVAFVLGTPIVRGDWRVFGFSLGPCLLVTWLLWFVLYRPSVRYDSERVVVTNMGRIHVLPWGHVAAVRQRLNIVFELDDGTSVAAWGAPLPRRRANILRNFERESRPEDPFHETADLLEEFRRAAAPSDAAVESRWDLVPLAIGLALVALVVVEFASRW